MKWWWWWWWWYWLQAAPLPLPPLHHSSQSNVFFSPVQPYLPNNTSSILALVCGSRMMCSPAPPSEHFILKGALCSFLEEMFIRREKKNVMLNPFVFMTDKNTQSSVCFKDNAVSYCFNLLVCGGPCHLSSFKQCSGDLILLWEQLVYLSRGVSLCYYLINIVNITVSFSTTTYCPFLIQAKQVVPDIKKKTG